MDADFQKITYSGTSCNSYIYFQFFGDSLDEDLISRSIGGMPTKVLVQGDPFPVCSRWMYQVDAGDDPLMEPYLNQILDLFEDKVEMIVHLKQEWGLNTELMFVLDIDIDPDASTPAFPLDSRVIRFLAATGTEVDFDLYKVDSLGVIPTKAIW